MKLGHAIFSTIIFLTTGCGYNSEPRISPLSIEKLTGAEYYFLDKGTIVTSPESIEGTGSLLFTEVLSREDNNFAVTFSLADGGSLTLVANSDRELKNGLTLRFSRKANELGVILTTKTATFDLTSEYEGVDASRTFALEADVHSHGHIILEGLTAEAMPYEFPKAKYGNLWGLRLDKAKVTKVVASKAKHEN